MVDNKAPRKLAMAPKPEAFEITNHRLLKVTENCTIYKYIIIILVCIDSVLFAVDTPVQKSPRHHYYALLSYSVL